MAPNEEKAAAAAAKKEAAAEKKAAAAEAKAAVKAKADAKKQAAAEKKAAIKAKADAKKAAAKEKAAAKKAAAKEKAEAARKPRVDTAELRVRLKEAQVEIPKGANEAALIALAEKADIKVPTIAKGSNIIPDEYRKKYGKSQSCGDWCSKAMQAATTVEVKTGKDGKKTKRVIDEKKLRSVAKQNKIDVDDRWPKKNIGMVRMNLSNVLRGMKNRGEQVTIGEKVFKGAKDGAGGAV